jgi:hypothetical protein
VGMLQWPSCSRDGMEFRKRSWRVCIGASGIRLIPVPTNEELRGDIVVVAFPATGWCGLAAMHFVPALRNRYYVGLLGDHRRKGLAQLMRSERSSPGPWEIWDCRAVRIESSSLQNKGDYALDTERNGRSKT